MIIFGRITTKMLRRLVLVLAVSLLLCDISAAQDPAAIRLEESRIQAKVPRRLRTLRPWWGVPVPVSPSVPADEADLGSLFACRPDTLSLPRWVCWNIDLSDAGEQRYKHEKLFPGGFEPPCVAMLRLAVDQAYKWAWRKPYGNTCVVIGYCRSTWYAAVCKKEAVNYPMTLEFSSIAFLIPEDTVEHSGNIYRYSQSVNRVENYIGYNLFPKLPDYCQELVEEMTTYELFCPFKEPDDNFVQPEFEFEMEYEMIEQTRE